MKNFEYLMPTSLDEAAQQATHKGALLRAGGVDLIDLMRNDVVAPTQLVNLPWVAGPEMREISLKSDGLHIGALVTLASVGAGRDVPSVLAQAAGEAATPQIRNSATVGGNLCQRPRCWYFRSAAFHCRKKGGDICYSQEGDNRYHAVFDNSWCAIIHPSSLAPALISLDATLVTNRRTMPVAEMFVRPGDDVEREHKLEPGEIIKEVVVPAGRTGGAYREGREKGGVDWALISASVWLDGKGPVKDARVVLGHAAPTPHRSKEAEAILAGQKVTVALATRAAEAAFKDATPMSGNAYKLQLGRAILKRTILAAAGLPEIGG